jgi:hypothetical protein
LHKRLLGVPGFSRSADGKDNFRIDLPFCPFLKFIDRASSPSGSRESRVKKRYQISKRRAAESFRDWAATNRKPIQLTFPTQSIAELSQRSLGDLLRSVGKLFIETVMESEVEQVVGQRSQPTKTGEPIVGGVNLAFV